MGIGARRFCCRVKEECEPIACCCWDLDYATTIGYRMWHRWPEKLCCGAWGFELAPLLENVDEQATIDGWEERLEKIRRKIERLGPINLAAIDEFKEQSERKEYLDSQLADLNTALATLESAIRKIDRETRTRFRETFAKVDAGFKRLFPKLFGGGHAYLELTGDDLLSAGVTVMARPPGKRNREGRASRVSSTTPSLRDWAPVTQTPSPLHLQPVFVP